VRIARGGSVFKRAIGIREKRKKDRSHPAGQETTKQVPITIF
jgi:hypothetical protein